MNTLQLREFFNTLNLQHTKVVVCAIDELPRTRLKMNKKSRYKNFAFIINLSKKAESGSHWTSLFINHNRHGFFIDSYSFKPRSWLLQSFIKRNCKQITYCTQQLQQLTSNVCGMYTACFIAHMASGHTFDSFTAKFSKNLLINDYVIVKLFNYFSSF